MIFNKVAEKESFFLFLLPCPFSRLSTHTHGKATRNKQYKLAKV